MKEESLKEMERHTKEYSNWIKEELKKGRKDLIVSRVGKINPMSHLERLIEQMLTSNITQLLGMALGKEIFYN